MIKNPNHVAEKQHIKGNYRIEPNAFDFTADSIKQLNSNLFYYSNDKKHVSHRKHIDIRTTTIRELNNTLGLPPSVPTDCTDEGWLLYPGKSYDVTSDIYVEVPEGMAAIIVGRSTGNRNGIIVTSGLYDSGFKGHIGCVIHVNVGMVFLAKGTFIGQIIFMDADSAKMYAGGYNTAVGEHWTDAPAVTKPEAIAKVEVPEVVKEVTKLEVPAEVTKEVPVVKEVHEAAKVDVVVDTTDSKSARPRRTK
jgi:deoxycytidine triphosphate deaminase